MSWNVNGIRACAKKGLLDVIAERSPDILCLQETKAHREQLDDELVAPAGYVSYFASAEKKGYSGVAIYAKERPLSISTLDVPEFDGEGRALIAKFADFTVINGYFPNSQAEGKRLQYKLDFNAAVEKYAGSIVAAGGDVVVCGDFNVAHTPIDLTHPAANIKNPGYLPEERAWMSRFLESGFTDTFRMFDEGPENYTWWSYRLRARERNIGWRLDYFVVNDDAGRRVTDASILADVFGSDHCPIGLTIQ